jgi:F-type H+-transporting ATPase subunit delta
MPKRASGKWYAQAIFELALQKEALEDCQAGLEKMARISRDESLMVLLENPKLPFEAKESLLRERLGEVHPFIFNLACLLANKDSLRLAGDISDNYRILYDAHRGLEHAEVTTAISIDDKDKEAISKRVEEVIGRSLALDLRVDPSIIGGFVARIGDMVIDGSVRQGLENLRKNLVEGSRS